MRKSDALESEQRSPVCHHGAMSPTARERARESLTTDILASAARMLAEAGPQELSLRAVARDVGLVSSAVYRYFPSRDHLLTALIVRAYDSLGERVATSEASVARGDLRGRWRTACSAVRDWAVENPHEYALIFGSPVPGYRAPQTTIEPATRVPLVLVRVVRDAAATGVLDAPGVSPSGRRGLAPELLARLRDLRRDVAPEVPPDVLARVLMAWAQLFGLVSFELFGHFVNSVDPTGPFFAHAVDQMADGLGLPEGAARAAAR